MTVLNPSPTELVAALGETAEEIAQTLANKGITGRKLNPDRCPLANYLREQGFARVVVGGSVVIVGGDRGERYPTTFAAMRFVAQFDHGKFPELDASA